MSDDRYLDGPVREDLARRMVFVAGPRQVGKTTLARRFLAEEGRGLYVNWDVRGDRAKFLRPQWPRDGSMVVLDEIHKWRPWKRWLKGEYDKADGLTRFLVTGSARMDVYRRGGDSLQGRYHHYRLHPFSAAEIALGGKPPAPPAPGTEPQVRLSGDRDAVLRLLARGGFPEPLFAASERSHRRWQRDRLDRFFREEVRDLDSVRDMGMMQVLADLLPDRVGSPLSLNAIREDLDVSHRAVSHWMDVLDGLYHTYRVRPFSPVKSRILKRMAKAYLWDWSEVQAPGPRFENLVASHLLKFVHWLEDVDGWRAELWYLRDRVGREVDFLVTVDRKPWFAVEAKVSADGADPSLRYFVERLRIPFAFQVVLEGNRDFMQDGIRCLPADRFLAALV